MGSPHDLAARARFEEEAAVRWRLLVGSGDEMQSARFGHGVWVERDDGVWVVRWTELCQRPWAEAAARSAPPGTKLCLGLGPRACEAALSWVERTHGVDLTTCEVRVGVTRGHLFAIVVSVPLDVAARPEVLDQAVESFCERLLGEEILDRWIVSIDVVRSARRSRLSVLPASTKASAETHPIALLTELVRIGIDAVLAGVPASQFEGGLQPWTALELGVDGSVQGDRLQAFTNNPEALKAALEGLPFDSARFTRGPEVMVWCAWSLDSLESRISGRSRAEVAVAALGGDACAICGSGFGARRDFLDLWVQPRAGLIRQLRAELAARLNTPVEIGFYDSRWALERPSPWPPAVGRTC